MDSAPRGQLKRSLSLLDVVALGVNGVIGQGIFLLPGLAAERLGPASLVAILIAGVLSFLIALCFAEVGSRFSGTGGAYLYAKAAFGNFVGFEVGWITCCVAIISWAALANGFTLVLAHFIPAVGEGWLQPATAVGTMTALVLVNLAGAKSGALVSTVFSVAKLLPMLLFVSVGMFALDGARFEPFAPEGYGPLAETTLLLLYAYVGFEVLVVPAGEMRNPQRNVPIALLSVLAIVSVVYGAVLAVSIGVFDGIAGHKNPVAAASGVLLGPVGGTIVAAGIVISVFGTNAGAALVSPRRIYAMAERGDLPRQLAWVHPKSGSPIPAIVVMYLLAAVLTLSGTFKELAVLGVIARFLQYIPTCLAVIVLRRKDASGASPGFRLPGGGAIPFVAVALCCWLMANSHPRQLWMGAAALAMGTPLYFLSRHVRANQTKSDD